MATAKGYFTRDGERRAWGSNLSRALWYTSMGSNGSAKEGRLSVAEFLDKHKTEIGASAEGGRYSWAQHDWVVTLPNGVRLGFVREV